MEPLEGKRVLVTGGTGSLGKTLVRRISSGEMGNPDSVIVFSRDETKQHYMRVQWQYHSPVPVTDEIVYRDFQQKLEFRIGDVRCFESVAEAVREADVVFNAAAMKQVPACEYAPQEAAQTNIQGAVNICRAIREQNLPVETVVGISTDKACKPVNVMGMTKAIQERVFVQANLRSPATRFVCVRYGNVLASRGSVIPLFHEQIRRGGPVTLTTRDMTRFLLSLEDAVDTVFAAVREAQPGETYIPRVPAASMANIARALIGDRDIALSVVGIRPGEKVHEVLVSGEEAHRTIERNGWYVIRPMLAELRPDASEAPRLTEEYCSRDCVMSFDETAELLGRHGLLVPHELTETADILQ